MGTGAGLSSTLESKTPFQLKMSFEKGIIDSFVSR